MKLNDILPLTVAIFVRETIYHHVHQGSSDQEIELTSCLLKRHRAIIFHAIFRKIVIDIIVLLVIVYTRAVLLRLVYTTSRI